MQKWIILFVASVLIISVGAGHATDRNPSTKPGTSVVTVTPCARGVVYVQMKSGSTVLRRVSGKGAEIQSVGGTPFDRVLGRLHVTTIVPFDEHAPKDAITRDLGIDRMYCIYYSNTSIDAHAALQLLETTGEVECGSVRYLFPLFKVPSDPLISQQYALTNMHVFQAWDVTTGDTNVIIADVDEGFNLNHEDLKNAWKVNWGESGRDAKNNDKRTNGIDDDSDGYIDNWRGWDVVGTANATNGDPFKPDNDPTPDFPGASHGCMTSGCLAASGENNKGGAGTAYGCRFLPVKAVGSDYNNVSGGYEGIHYASTHGARIINCSWGGPTGGADETFANIFLQEAIDRNALVVAAAGNDHANTDLTPYYPTNGPGVLSVGATDQTNAPANFSNYGHTVSVWAPGVGILSTSWPGNNAYVAEDGTSFASPLTAGVAGLVASVHPSWPARFIARQIIQTIDNVVNPADPYNYSGLVDAAKAVGAPVGPGIEIVSYTLDGVPSDSLGAVGKSSDLKVTFKNFIAAGTSLSATLEPRTGYTVSSGATVTLGNMAVDQTAIGDFQITRTGVYSEGKMPIRFFFADTSGYADSVDLLIPLRVVPGFVKERSISLGQGIKRVSNTDAWVCAGFEGSGVNTLANYFREQNGLWADSGVVSDGLAAPYDMEALDSLTAYFGTGKPSPLPTYASVIFTKDGGKTFSNFEVTGFTPFVNTVHFFDRANGIIIGDPPQGSVSRDYWGIGVTSDSGNTWNALAKPVLNAVTGEASWNNGTCWVGNNGWFGSNSNRIWHSTDRGQTWTSTKALTYKNCFSVAFDDDALHGIACFRPVSGTGKPGVMLSSNGGVTWSVLLKTQSPAPGMIPGSVAFISGAHTGVLTSDSGVYRTTDWGATWTPIGIPVTYDALNGDLSIFHGGSQTTMSFISSSNGIATYSEGKAGISADPSPINFGTVDVGLANSLTTTITNDGTGPITITGISINPSSGAFTNASVSLPVTLPPGGTLKLTVTFQPVANGGQNASLTLTLTDGTTMQISLNGIGNIKSGVADDHPSDGLTLTVTTNPFHGATAVQYELPKNELVRLGVFDAVGREVAVLANGTESEGLHTVSFDASSLPAGIYYCTLQTASGSRVTRAVTSLK